MSKTTVAGVLAIAASLASAGSALLLGHSVDWASVAAAVTAGVGLIHASDAPAPKA